MSGHATFIGKLFTEKEVYRRENIELQSKLKAQQELIDIMKEALEFYASHSTYITNMFLPITPTSDSNTIIYDDLERVVARDGSYDKKIGGKRARLALAKMEAR